MNELTLYSMEGCAKCVDAANLLTAKNIPFKVVKIDEDMEAAAFIRKEGHRSLPQIYEGDKLFATGGFVGLQKYFAGS